MYHPWDDEKVGGEGEGGGRGEEEEEEEEAGGALLPVGNDETDGLGAEDEEASLPTSPECVGSLPNDTTLDLFCQTAGRFLDGLTLWLDSLGHFLERGYRCFRVETLARRLTPVSILGRSHYTFLVGTSARHLLSRDVRAKATFRSDIHMFWAPGLWTPVLELLIIYETSEGYKVKRRTEAGSISKYKERFEGLEFEGI
ncbi:hypothetical protein KPH14_003075 [Odynerus spinipes]|uniref:Uncharacterized protein n=1 Tax=Odynerus spinipes TaxID=1348599 RepID=A0AAD9VUD9_9HYME|nr:hypothetical protein KPH14_003075 [Odynerus spinipes]